MKFTSTLAVVFAVCTYVAAIPLAQDPSPIQTASSAASTPSLPPKVLGSLSSWFGWQLAGASTTQDELAAGCNKLPSIGGNRWAAIGLVPASIKEPMCTAAHGMPNPVESVPNTIPHISNIFGVQLAASFTTDEAFTYLCDHLSWSQMNQFYINDQALFKAVCDKAGDQIPPRPYGIEAGVPLDEASLRAALNTASLLYASIYAAGAVTDTVLNTNCAHAPNRISNLNLEKLNGTLVEQKLCSFKKPLSVEEARKEIMTWTSRLFTTVLENIGMDANWLPELCQTLSVEGMNSVGLQGADVKNMICKDAQAGAPTVNVLPKALPSADGKQ